MNIKKPWYYEYLTESKANKLNDGLDLLGRSVLFTLGGVLILYILISVVYTTYSIIS